MDGRRSAYGASRTPPMSRPLDGAMGVDQYGMLRDSEGGVSMDSSMGGTASVPRSSPHMRSPAGPVAPSYGGAGGPLENAVMGMSLREAYAAQAAA